MKATRVLVWITMLVLASACAKKNDSSQGEKAGDHAATTTAPGDTIGRRPWRWIGTETSNGRIVCINPDVYKITFFADSTVRVLVDCNRGSGPYHAANHAIRIGPFATTRMMCPPGSMDTTFVRQLQAARDWHITADTLQLGLTAESRMQFVR